MAAETQEGREPFISRVEKKTRAMVIVPLLHDHDKDDIHTRSVSSRVEEALGLTKAIHVDIVFHQAFVVANPKPATLIGAGKVEELSAIAQELAVDLVVIDHSLTPVQQRNLEREWHCKVIDRTALILEIFGERARTKEGVLQVELAHLNYQKGRLVRSWTHLERQRGGAGFLGGPGETQIEADRRILQDKITKIRRELETVVKTRALHRAKRKRTPHPVIALVGYTNAGKSTLFNRLTGADVLAKDMLFATLDPTLRRVNLPHGETVIFSDTVGFISNLPTHLVASFRATLEEVIEADMILHVRDMSDPDHHAHAADVRTILESLGVDTSETGHIIEVWNKFDLLDETARQTMLAAAQSSVIEAFAVSSLTGEGINTLLGEIERRISGQLRKLQITLLPEQLSMLDWIYHNAKVTNKKSEENGNLVLTVEMTDSARKIFQRRIMKPKEAE